MPIPGIRMGESSTHASTTSIARPEIGESPNVQDGELVEHLRQGSHYVFIGEVADIALGDGAPLVYAKRACRGLGLPLEALPQAA